MREGEGPAPDCVVLEARDGPAHRKGSVSLQQDVLYTIPPDGIEKDQLRERVGNIGQAELDVVTDVDIANIQAQVAEHDQFLELYERFAGEGAQ